MPQALVPLGVRLLGALLLNEGGSAVCLPPHDLDRLAILSGRGMIWRTPPIPVRRVRGLPSRCHANVAWLYEEARRVMEIATGYALSDDGMWRQHSWLHVPHRLGPRLIETTAPRTIYLGVVLDTGAAAQFCAANT